ncbi:hypothetical protein [Sphingomonas sanxanigenens]|uniref:ParB/Sulfiredoxin domain-containing protein n=1 Tax=Sphingomonas sanxanigenens DSM 19645 = NX02 TaxID=1123269 RepID=W0AFJ7_9SPHN|nr:hypothetical protein [Sphingomonas sanxanigenens]AHE55886.1 hypothetical protein NX02_21250 [Sphingomonas sanxanigenens DSM 19645 = NX02]
MTTLPIASIRRDGGTQPRDHVSLEVAKDYAEALADGAVMPPVTVFYDGTDYWLADGFHRLEAHLLIEAKVIEADIQQGVRRDAVLYSVGANATHGYPRSNMDKRRAVLTLLNDPEWSQWSDREIARRCGVQHPLVGKLRPPASLVADTSEVRTFIDRHGNPSHMRIGAIGKPKPPLPEIAGRKPERKPDLSFATSEESGIPTASRITGLSPRNLAEMARAGEIEGAEKCSGSWVFPTAVLVDLVKVVPEPVQDQAVAEVDEVPTYNFEANSPKMQVIDHIEALLAGPTAAEMLAWWEHYIGAGFDDGAVDQIYRWVSEFHAGFAAAERTRRARIDASLERIQSDVVE